MNQQIPWHEQDEFWQTVEPFLFSKQRLSDATAEVENFASLMKIKPGMRLLDLCCGIGRHSLEFARRGFIVTGVDKMQPYLARAAARAESERIRLELVRADMRMFCKPNTFDAAINIYTSFGYFENPDDDRRVLRNIFHSLKSGGVFLIDIMGKEILARIFREKDWHEEDGMIVLQDRKIRNNWGWIECRWIFLRDNERIELALNHRLYSAMELSERLTECGFKNLDVFGDFEGNAYDENAQRLVIVARK
ncbi:methyltransferase domain-containing protein [candidate division KSB1 bacterium]|nr:methyltransferase domain-containing protein [candidate division KSB1 bacterium]